MGQGRERASEGPGEGGSKRTQTGREHIHAEDPGAGHQGRDAGIRLRQVGTPPPTCFQCDEQGGRSGRGCRGGGGTL